MEVLFYKKYTNVPFTGKVAGKGQGELKDGKLDGPFVSYYDNGQLQSQGPSKDGEMEGPWVSYNKDGTLDEEYTGTFKDDMKISD